jgi:hypothetical protein
MVERVRCFDAGQDVDPPGGSRGSEHTAGASSAARCWAIGTSLPFSTQIEHAEREIALEIALDHAIGRAW